MSVPSLSTAASPPPAPTNQPHDAAAKFGGGAAFSALLSTFAGETPHTGASSSSGNGETAANGQPSGQDEPGSNPSQSLEADLVGLVLGALPTGENSAQESSGPAGSKKHATADDETGQTPDASAVPPIAPLWLAPAEFKTPANPTATAAATQAISTALASVGATTANAGNSSLAALASAAARSAKPIFENAGALTSPQEAASEAAATPISFTVLQNRTHLGVDGADQTLAKDPFLRAQAAQTADTRGGRGRLKPGPPRPRRPSPWRPAKAQLGPPGSPKRRPNLWRSRKARRGPPESPNRRPRLWPPPSRAPSPSRPCLPQASLSRPPPQDLPLPQDLPPRRELPRQRDPPRPPRRRRARAPRLRSARGAVRRRTLVRAPVVPPRSRFMRRRRLMQPTPRRLAFRRPPRPTTRAAPRSDRAGAIRAIASLRRHLPRCSRTRRPPHKAWSRRLPRA